MENKFQKIIKENKIWLGIILIFVLFVSYKVITIGIQEDKEKSVLQEKYNLEQAKESKTTNNINLCLEEAQLTADKDTAFIRVSGQCWAVGIFDKGSSDQCYANNGEGRELCKLQPDKCSEYVNEKISKIKNELKSNKEECYKRYK